jgi:hypothetical protein
MALPGLIRVVREGGWGELRRPVLATMAAAAPAAALTAPILLWVAGRRATPTGTGLTPTHIVGALWAASCALAILALAAGGAAIAARIEIPKRTLRRIGALAVAVTAAMVAVSAGIAGWSAAMAVDGRRFFSGGGLFGLSTPLTLAGIGLLTAGGVAVAVAGACRVAGARSSA